MASEGGEKTEAPTPQKLKELRKKNTVRRSQDLPSAFSMVALVLALPMLVSGVWNSGKEVLGATLLASGTTDINTAPALFGWAMVDMAKGLFLPLGLVIASIVLANVSYTRSKPNPAAIKPTVKKLNPISGVKNMFSPNTLVEFLKGVAKLVAVGVVAYFAWQAAIEELLTGFSSVEAAAGIVGGSVMTMITWVACIAVVIGSVDAWWQNKRYNKQAKMSLDEVKREYKQSEGDPHIKAQIRQRGQALARNNMVAATADADVVVVNPTHIAIALKYEAGMAAPKVIAKGQGEIAKRIRAVATDNDVPIRKDVPLARALHKSTKVDQFIPVELWEAAAALLSEVFKSRR